MAPEDRYEEWDKVLWPAECLREEGRYGRKTARLYPLINRRVSTPRGGGVLINAIGDQARVLFDRETELVPKTTKNVKRTRVVPAWWITPLYEDRIGPAVTRFTHDETGDEASYSRVYEAPPPELQAGLELEEG